MSYLIVNKNFKEYKVFPVFDQVMIGRSSKNHIVLKDPEDALISRKHACLQERKDGFWIVDTSANGTFVDGARIEECLMVHGLRFRISDYQFIFVDEELQPGIVASPEGMLPPESAKATIDSVDEEETVFFSQPVYTRKEGRSLKDKLKDAGIITESPCMIALYEDIVEIARVNIPVIILGEPGTGKEKVAETLHCFANPKGAFVPLNCSSIPEGVFESELFGSVKGAFHDATNKPGKFEMAHNGTIFLDEIGDMLISLQPKLLRFLEDKQVTRLGDTKVRTLNVRVVAATNQDLQSMIAARTFRDDLYQRLACIKLEIPPLRERKEDIPALAEFFLTTFSKEHDLQVKRITSRAMDGLISHPWPGNVRELRNVLLGAAVRCRSGAMEPQHFSGISRSAGGGEAVAQDDDDQMLSLKDIEKSHIIKTLERVGGNKLKAAKVLGISRDTLYKKLQKYGIG